MCKSTDNMAGANCIPRIFCSYLALNILAPLFYGNEYEVVFA